jgi:hypothetical protein
MQFNPKPMITQDEAVAVARARAVEKGWALLDPINVSKRVGWSGKIKSYCVESDPALRGSKSRFTIDATTGVILEEGYVPR